MRKFGWIGIVALCAGACDDGTGPESGEPVRIRFGVTGTAGAAAVNPAASPTGDELRIEGSNGTLRIEEIRLIVAEFALERAEGTCDTEEDDDCEELEFTPFLLNLRLDGGADPVAVDRVVPGTFTELEFEVEDLEEDEDDDLATRRAIATIRTELESAFPEFPREASMVVRGGFTPTGGRERPFVTFFDADIEIELDLSPALVVTEDGASHAITVALSPARWFRSGDEVLDLSALQSRVVEFEAEFERGVVEARVEVEDD